MPNIDTEMAVTIIEKNNFVERALETIYEIIEDAPTSLELTKSMEYITYDEL